jgi:hypothetical protein
MLRFIRDNGALMEGFGQWVATNLGLGENMRMGPGRVITIDGVTTEEAQPSLAYIAAMGQYQQHMEMLKEDAKSAMRNVGLPDELVSDMGGVPSSGYARLIARQELIEVREDLIPCMRQAEQGISDLTAVVYNTDVAAATGAPALPTGLDCSVDYEEEGIILDAAERLTLNCARLIVGATTPSRFMREEAGIDRPMTDDEAMTELTKRIGLIKPLIPTLAVVAGLTLPEAPAVTSAPPAASAGSPAADPTQQSALPSQPLDNANPIQ